MTNRSIPFEIHRDLVTARRQGQSLEEVVEVDATRRQLSGSATKSNCVAEGRAFVRIQLIDEGDGSGAPIRSGRDAGKNLSVLVTADNEARSLLAAGVIELEDHALAVDADFRQGTWMFVDFSWPHAMHRCKSPATVGTGFDSRFDDVLSDVVR